MTPCCGRCIPDAAAFTRARCKPVQKASSMSGDSTTKRRGREYMARQTKIGRGSAPVSEHKAAEHPAADLSTEERYPLARPRQQPRQLPARQRHRLQETAVARWRGGPGLRRQRPRHHRERLVRRRRLRRKAAAPGDAPAPRPLPRLRPRPRQPGRSARDQERSCRDEDRRTPAARSTAAEAERALAAKKTGAEAASARRTTAYLSLFSGSAPR
jgi:hypothetical protein